MQAIYGLIAFNILIIPLLIILHFIGECKLLIQSFGDSFQPLCRNVTNLGLNILYVNGILGVIILFVMGNKMTTVSKHPKQQAPPQPPPHHQKGKH